MPTVRFTKAEGAQNDFVIVDDRGRAFPIDARKRFTRLVCHRRKGVGADGTIFIEDHRESDFTMVFYNPDGSDGSMCGNGGRCAALYALRRGIAPEHMSFHTLDRLYRAEVSGESVRLFFPPPTSIRWPMPAGAGGADFPLYFVHNGAPHVVVLYDDIPLPAQSALEDFDLAAFARPLRHHADFQPEGANVNVARIDDDGLIRIRTFEKGVEAETEACGTGNLATAMIVHLVRRLPPPLRLLTRGGDTLIVGFDAETSPSADPAELFSRSLFLEGPARLVFEGSMNFDPSSVR